MTDPTPAPPSDSNPAATKSEDDAAKPPSKGRYRGRGRRNNANAQTKTATAKGANDRWKGRRRQARCGRAYQAGGTDQHPNADGRRQRRRPR